MKKWSALNLLGALVLGAALIAFVVLIVLHPMLTAQEIEITAEVSGTGEGETAEAPRITAAGRIAYIGKRGDNYDIYTMNPDGSDILRLTTDPGEDSSPQWSPDGSQIAFLNYGGEAGLYLMNADGSAQTQLTASQSIGSYSWDVDGTRIAFINDDGLYAVDLSSSSEPILLLEDRWIESANWGSIDLFVLTSCCEQSESATIQLFDLTNGSLTPVAADNLYPKSPAWSPDNKQVAVVLRDDHDFAFQITYADNSIPPRQLITDMGHMNNLSWSPDGKWLAFLGAPEYKEYSVFIISIENGSPQKLIETGPDVSDIDWSPDSTQLLITWEANNEPGVNESNMTLVSIDGSNIAQITDDGWHSMPDWQPITTTFSDAIYTSTPTLGSTQTIDDLLDEGMATLTLLPQIQPLLPQLRCPPPIRMPPRLNRSPSSISRCGLPKTRTSTGRSRRPSGSISTSLH
jgi:Tol biopolymer transport system component